MTPPAVAYGQALTGKVIHMARESTWDGDGVATSFCGSAMWFFVAEVDCLSARHCTRCVGIAAAHERRVDNGDNGA